MALAAATVAASLPTEEYHLESAPVLNIFSYRRSHSRVSPVGMHLAKAWSEPVSSHAAAGETSGGAPVLLGESWLVDPSWGMVSATFLRGHSVCGGGGRKHDFSMAVGLEQAGVGSLLVLPEGPETCRLSSPAAVGLFVELDSKFLFRPLRSNVEENRFRVGRDRPESEGVVLNQTADQIRWIGGRG